MPICRVPRRTFWHGYAVGNAFLTRGAASDCELPEPRYGYRLVPCERVGDGGEHGANRPLGVSPGGGGLCGDVGDELGLVHAVFPSSCGWASDDGASQVKRAAWGEGTQPAVRERWGTPEPSSNRMQVGSTWDELERSGDGQPRVERERGRDSIVFLRTSSSPRRLAATRPGFPAG